VIEDLIYDVGMNTGDDTAYYLHRGYRVVAIEADPVLVSQASERFRREIDAGRLTILNVAIAEEPGILPFWICEAASKWNSFDRNSAARDGSPHHQIEVQCRRLDSILEEFGVPYYLKIDIEGSDLICMKQIKTHDTPKYISCESDNSLEALHLLRALGYSGFKCLSQLVYLPVELPLCREQRNFEIMTDLLNKRNIFLRIARRLGAWRPMVWQIQKTLQRARAINVNGWSFNISGGLSSGPFGDDTPGRWQGFEELCETYQHYQRLARERKPCLFWTDAENGEKTFWVDFHARRDG
jgi:FkbM family methyltransferase